MPVEMTRAEFLDEYWSYEPGQHILFVAPTGAGKSYFAWQLLEKTMEDHPGLRYVSFMPKTSDPTTARNALRLGLEEVPVWPPRKRLFHEKPRGYVLWPKHPHGPGVTTEMRRMAVGTELKKGLEDQYWAGRSVSFIDDAHSAAALMDLNSNIEEILTNGRAGGAGMWLATQKPSGTVATGGLTSFAWGSASKMFFSKDSDKRNLDRLSEIGAGVDPREVADWIRNLKMFEMNGHSVGEFLYLDKAGPYAVKVLPW